MLLTGVGVVALLVVGMTAAAGERLDPVTLGVGATLTGGGAALIATSVGSFRFVSGP